MARTAARHDPFVAFRFELSLDDLPVAGFSECSGLQLETEMQDYPEGGLNTHLRKFPTRTKQTNIVLKRGLIDRQLWSWYFDLAQGTVRRRNVSILLRDAAGETVVMEWRVTGALPSKWTGPELNATQSTVATETLELAHEGLELTR